MGNSGSGGSGALAPALSLLALWAPGLPALRIPAVAEPTPAYSVPDTPFVLPTLPVSAPEFAVLDPLTPGPGFLQQGVPTAVDARRIVGDRNFWTGYPALNPDGSINVVVEIPAGTNEKWEVTHDGTALEWTLEDGAPRIIQYLAYPANYGMVPRTLQAAETGGDGDPLDVVILGPALSRAEVVAARPIGVLQLIDDGERDDKVIAVPLEGPLSDVADVVEVAQRYPGVALILETWFRHYKGSGRVESDGFASAEAAAAVLEQALAAFERAKRR